MENKDTQPTETLHSSAPATEVASIDPGAPATHRRHRRPPTRATRATRADDSAEAAAPTETPVPEVAEAAPEAPATPASRRHRRGYRGRGAAETPAGAAATPAAVEQAITPIVETVRDMPAAPSFDSIVPSYSPMSQIYINGKAATPVAPAAAPESSAAPATSEPKPQRRYRFDRPAPTVTTAPATPVAPAVSDAPAPAAVKPASSRRAAQQTPLWRRLETPPAVTPDSAPAPREPEVITATEAEFILRDAIGADIGVTSGDNLPVEQLTDDHSLNGDEVATPAERSRGRRRRGRGGRGTGAQAAFEPIAAAPLYQAEEERPVAAARYAPESPAAMRPATTVTPLMPSPYGSPEPMSARGFGATPRGVASELRAMPTPRSRADRGGDAPISVNHMAGVLLEAIQQQTDRLLADQRRSTAAPTFTVAFPSTERVGVFVDVANLLYSSRSMRIPIDFGSLLGFLRGDRRLIRAHAYCPTSPEPYADQQFLQAVKGLGYRITTKDYKTFSSGAKKADLDLDLCMDIVRIVDAGAVDTIVLVSGDSDFLPLLSYCSDHGVRVEVAAFDESTAAILRQSCDLFINLSLVEDIRA